METMFICPPICLWPSISSVYVRFSLNVVQKFFTKCCQASVGFLTVNLVCCAVFKCTNGFVPIICILLDQFGWNSVWKIFMWCRLAFMSLMKFGTMKCLLYIREKITYLPCLLIFAWFWMKFSTGYVHSNSLSDFWV